MNMYVGNIPHSSSEQELQEAFEAFGTVSSAKIIKDKYSGDSRGFGFVEMDEKSEAEKAMAELDGKDFQGRQLSVNEARPRTDNRGGNRDGGNYRGGGGNRRSW